MRKLIPFMCAVFILVPLSGQVGKFKTVTRNPAGTSSSTLNFVKINGKSNLKSTSAPAAPYRLSVFNPAQIAQDRKVIYSGNIPVYIESSSPELKSASLDTPEKKLIAFMESVKSVTGIDKPAEAFFIRDVKTDELGMTHIRVNRKYKGIELYGVESTLHLGKGNPKLTGSTGRISGDLPTIPSVSENEAVQLAWNDLKTLTVCKDLTAAEKKLLQYDRPVRTLVYYNTEEDGHVLAWSVEIRPNMIEVWKYFVDALTGQILFKFNNTNSDGPATANAVDLNGVTRTVDTYLETGTYYLANVSESMYNSTTGDGMILTLDAGNTSTNDLNYSYITSANNTWNHPAAISAHYNGTKAFEYFWNTFNRNSLNNQGGSIISFVNVSEEDGSSMENAFWNGKAVFYGNGGTHFEPLAGALDVAAHELGHGVVTNTANLDYVGQSGAMNESFADIFGAMVDREDWNIGEDVTKTSYSPSGSLRNMADPHNQGTSANSYWQPAHMSEIYLGTADNGGVHKNSGIINHAYYLYATAVTKEKAEQIFYRALFHYLSKTSQFIDLRIAVIQAATDIYGSGSQEVAEAGEAFTAVGIFDDQPTHTDNDYEPNPGQDYLLSYDTNPAETDRLWRSSTTGTNFAPLSASEMKGKVSVTDDGSAALFVSLEDKIRVLSTNPNNLDEYDLSDEAFFDNVAISKDGKRLAAISIEIDTAIYVYDFETAQWVKFTLYNPTTSEGESQAGGVLYADAIEFDNTGEYLIYDAFNQFNSDLFEDISYWDIGFIRVWDNFANDFGDGTIAKLYGSLPDNVSIGNPVFSKNSADIIAFDYFNETDNEFAILGANLSSGEVGMITTNSILGYPSFSKNDDKIAFSALTETDDEVVASIGLDPDKITGSGSAAIVVENAKWPVYYATGTRALGLAPVSNFTADLNTGNAPLEVQFFDLSDNAPTSWAWTFEGGTPATSNLQNPAVTYTNGGTFKVTLVATNVYGNHTKTKNGYIVVAGPTGVPTGEIRKPVAYPNPVTDVLHIRDAGAHFTVKVTDMQGKLIRQAENTETIDVSGCKPGLYLLEIRTGESTVRQKILVR